LYDSNVIKKKVEAKAAPEPKRVNTDATKEAAAKAKKDDSSSSDSGGGGALGGLMCYGSDSS